MEIKLFSNKKTALLSTTGYLLFIFLTLPVTPIFVRSLSSRGFLNTTISLLLVAVISFLVWGGYRSGRLKTIPFWVAFFLVLAFYFGIESFTTSSVEKLHVWLYGTAGFFLFSTLRFWHSSTKLFLLVFLSVTLAGTTDELIQYFLPNRVFSISDILFNLFGGLISLIVIRYIFGDDGKKI